MVKWVRTKMLLGAIVCLLVPSAIYADAILTFDIPATEPLTATISYAGGFTPLLGSGITVDKVTGSNTTLHNGGTIKIIGGVLNFQTLNYSSHTLSSWFFDDKSPASVAASYITITAKCLDLNGDNDTTCDASDYHLPGFKTFTVLTGFWETGQVDKEVLKFRIVDGTFDDTKVHALLAYYGLTAGSGFGSEGTLTLGFSTSASPPSAFTTHSVSSGKLVNDVVPEPASLALFGTGLIGVAGLARRKFLRRN